MVMAVALVAASYLSGLVRAGLPLELLELGEVGGEPAAPVAPRLPTTCWPTSATPAARSGFWS